MKVPVTVVEKKKLGRIELSLAGKEDAMLYLRSGMDNISQATLRLYDEDGMEMNAQAYDVTYAFESADSAIATVDQDGAITPLALGKTTIRAGVTIDGVTKNAEMGLTVEKGKSAASYYTEEKQQNARENAQKYAWAREARTAAINAANKYVGLEDKLWDLVTTQELPRSYYVGYREAPGYTNCRYCGVNIVAKYGSSYPWLHDALNRPWKIQCPDCRRWFPSNDFGSFYELGIDEHGNWSYEQSKAENAKLVAEGKPGYLINVEYPEKDKELGITGWGVDDGYGYDTGNTYSNGTKEVHTYISYYNHWAVWYGSKSVLQMAAQELRSGYLHTGEAKYGRVGAILMDRIADVYPEMTTQP